MDKHERIWQCYMQFDDEFDEPIRKALTAIEQIEGLPNYFEIWDIKLKENFGIRMAYENAGDCWQKVEHILNQLEEETWRMTVPEQQKQSVTDSLVGVLQYDYDDKKIREEKAGRYAYPAIFTYEPEKEIAVVFPDLDVATSGTNDDDALLSAREMLECVLQSLAEDGEPIPVPTALEAIFVEQNERAVLVEANIAGEPLIFHSSLSMDEIEKNFEGVDISEGIKAGLEEALEYADPELRHSYHGEDCPGNGENGNPCCCDNCEFGLECLNEDIAVAQEAYDEYVKSGGKSRPIAELWKELGLEDSLEYSREEKPAIQS